VSARAEASAPQKHWQKEDRWSASSHLEKAEAPSAEPPVITLGQQGEGAREAVSTEPVESGGLVCMRPREGKARLGHPPLGG
jgi:hypothetical protein